jgi:ribokinase
MAPRIAVVGSANTDLITFSDAFPRPGETIFGQNFDLGFGGKGANQAIAARLCGAEVVMVARVGNDLFGEATIKNFASFGIDTTHVKIVPGVPTGVAPIFVDPSGQNRIIVVKGANDRLLPADVDAAAPQLRSVDTIILQFEIPLETIYHTVRFARANNIRCIVNPAPALPADLAQLAAADYFIPNETEAELIGGQPVHTVEEAVACANALLRKGFRKVVLTLGARGALLADKSGAEHVAACQSLRRPVNHPRWNPEVFPQARGLRDRMRTVRPRPLTALHTTKKQRISIPATTQQVSTCS